MYFPLPLVYMIETKYLFDFLLKYLPSNTRRHNNLTIIKFHYKKKNHKKQSKITLESY